MPSKRRSDYASDDGFVAADSDASDRPSKKAKTEGALATAGALVDSEGNQYWEISKTRRVTVSEFKGRTMVAVREYYEKDGKALPGKKVNTSSTIPA